ncbi:MAG: hypothetical protein AB8B85_08455 [Paracoccaceae bacterium]
MTHRIPDPANTNAPLLEFDDTELDTVTGGAEAEYPVLTEDGATPDAELSEARTDKDIVMNGKKIFQK